MDIENKTILIVDDEPTVLMSVSMMLETKGCSVEKASSGDQALQILNEKSSFFDCILLDYSMPKKNGLMVLQEIRETEINTPVIMCSGLNIERADSSFEHWPDQVLSKPFKLAQLIEIIANVC